MTNSLFYFNEYRAYLRDRSGKPGTRQGHRSAMAKAIKCHSSYLTKVLNYEAHVSLEQAYRFNAYFNHSPEESHFFLLLVQKGRAGTKDLEQYFGKQLQEISQRRLLIRERIDIKKTLSSEDQATYYANWYYAAIHVALTIPELRTKEALVNYFGLHVSKVVEALEFLTSVGLVTEKAGTYQVGEVQIHLGSQSQHIGRHHTNWRTQAIASFDREASSDLHYSAVVSVSKADAIKVKDTLIEAVKNTTRFISKSKEEEVFSFVIDFFGLKR